LRLDGCHEELEGLVGRSEGLFYSDTGIRLLRFWRKFLSRVGDR
jgi:hypothetical protein